MKAIEGLLHALEMSKKKFESVRTAKYFNPVANEWQPSVVQWTAKEQIELIDKAIAEYKRTKSNE